MPPPPPHLPPPPPSPPPAGAGNSINLVVNGLVRALSVSKIGFFVLGAIILYVLMALTAVLLAVIVAATRSGGLAFVGMFVAIVVYMGLIGVLAGGMAHLADMDERGRKAGIGSALGFCVSRFVSLFMGAVLFAVVIVVLLAMVNGLALVLNMAGTAGSFLAAMLFLPQFAIDLALGIALAVWVVVPVAIATENLTALQAIGRLETCLRRDARRLFAHFAVSAAIGTAILSVLGALFWLPVVAVVVTNSPLPSILGALMKLSPNALMTGVDYSFGPDFLRMFFAVLVGLAVAGYLSVYWVGSFTGYYKDALRRGFRASPLVVDRVPDGPPMVSCPQCRRQFKINDSMRGKRVSCPYCHYVWTIPPLPPPPVTV